ncbi:MAG: hypothetical protein ACI9D4_000268, partial [Polaribacter sp.]
MLQNHFKNKKGNVEENYTSEIRSIISTKAYTSGSYQNNDGNLYSFIPYAYARKLINQYIFQVKINYYRYRSKTP